MTAIFQNKIEILYARLPLFGKKADLVNLKSILKRVEDFKRWRNALAHRIDVSTDDTKPQVSIEVVRGLAKRRQSTLLQSLMSRHLTKHKTCSRNFRKREKD